MGGRGNTKNRVTVLSQSPAPPPFPANDVQGFCFQIACELSVVSFLLCGVSGKKLFKDTWVSLPGLFGMWLGFYIPACLGWGLSQSLLFWGYLILCGFIFICVSLIPGLYQY